MKAATWVTASRKKMGLNKSQLAEALGHDRKTIGRWERGENDPCYEDVRKIEALLRKNGAK